MRTLKKIDAAFESVIKSTPVIGFLGVIATAAILCAIGVFLALKAPLVLLTLGGVAVTWALVLFGIKFTEAFKRI